MLRNFLNINNKSKLDHFNFRKTLKNLSLSHENILRKRYSTSLEPKQEDTSKQVQKFIRRGKNRQEYRLKENELVTGFRVKRIINFDEFQMKGFILEHEKTGAKYFHIDSSDLNNAFGIHFCTPAFDNTGVFHILEHLTLCGSKKFPVRDPFMNMMKRSLNSYMNAWTGPDYTMYPFAAQNIKDFQNLRDVYLDATFFPNLDYKDFLQEGWRFEFLEPSNRKSGLLYKGVVLNEMKGDMSRQDSYFIHKLQSNLFVNSTYKFNSGGDPRFIPTLKYENLVETHKKYYHPSNSKFFSYGDMNFLENLEFLEDNLLSKLDPNNQRGKRFSVPKSIRLEEPKEVIEFYQTELGLGNQADNLAKMAIAYLCEDINENPYETFKLSILSHLLMEGPNSIMYKRLIESGLAPGYCHGYGLDTTLKESTMTIGVQNIENDYRKFKEVEDAIMSGISEIADKGFEYKLVEEVLHLIEYDSKKPKDDFAINLFNQSSGFITHSDYPFPMLHMNEFSYRLKKELKENPNLFQNMIKRYFLSNSHRLKLILRPKSDLISNLNREEFESLSRIDNGLTENEVIKIIEDTEKLVEHQSQIQNMEILPCLGLEDIQTYVESISIEKSKLLYEIPLLFLEQPTNGLSFIRVKANINDIPDDLKEYVPLYNLILPRLGTKDHTYEEFQNMLHTNSAGLSISVDAYSDINDINKEYENLVYEMSFLDNNMQKALQLYTQLMTVPNFFELTNLNQIIKQESVKIANDIVGNSLDYAISYASAGLKSFKRTYSSFKSDMFICRLGSDLLQCASPRDILQSTAEKLYLLHNLILRKTALQFSLNGSKKHLEGISVHLNLLLNQIKKENEVFDREINKELREEVKFEEKYYKTVIKTPAQVNECVEVFKIPHFNHPDYPKCVVMSNLIGLSILHKEIREKGGAYGSGVSPSDSGLCVFYSYRDPNAERTYNIFEKAIIQVKEGKFAEQEIKDAKIYTFSIVDKIINPSNKGLELFLRNLDENSRNIFRNRLLTVNKEDIIEMCSKYLVPQLENGTTSRVVFGNVSNTGQEAMFDSSEWEFLESLDFLSEKYFSSAEDEEKQI